MEETFFDSPDPDFLSLVFREVVRQDEYMFTDIKNEPEVFIDIGANIGISTIFALTVFRGLKKVISVEPHPLLYNYLEHNLDRFKGLHEYLPEIYLVNRAFGESGVEYAFTTEAKNYGMFRTFEDPNKTEKVQSISLQELLTTYQVKADDKVVFKCDCEGCEKVLLDNTNTQLMSNFYQISMELHHGTKYFADCPTPERYKEWLKAFVGHRLLVSDWRSDKNGKVVLRKI